MNWQLAADFLFWAGPVVGLWGAILVLMDATHWQVKVFGLTSNQVRRIRRNWVAAALLQLLMTLGCLYCRLYLMANR